MEPPAGRSHIPSLVAACGGGDGGSESSGELKDVLNFENWPYYMDTKETRTAAGLTGPTTLEQFDQEKGIKVNYYEGIDSNDGYFAKIQGQLSQGQGIGRDIIVATDNSSSRACTSRRSTSRSSTRASSRTSQTSSTRSRARASIQTGLLAPVAHGHRRDRLERGAHRRAGHEHDPTADDPKLKGKVTLLGEMADTLGLVLIDNGDDPTDVSDEAFDRAIKSVQDALDAGQILSSPATTTGRRWRG